jgi:hypothetical protein
VRGTQIGLRAPEVVDRIKADMRAGRYAYQEPRGRIAGVRDARGTYHVKVGHHRMAAAMEVYRENGDPAAVWELIYWGFWDEVERPPIDSRPLPARGWWGALRNWLGV